jgi:Mg-chelatase subunit ChlD
MRRSFCTAFLVTLIVGLVAASLPHPSFAAKALNEKGLLRLVELGTDESKVIANIEKQGVDFDVNDAALKQLKEGGASEAVIQAVQKAGKAVGSKKPAKAVSLNDVVELLENGADEGTILSLLQKSPTLFTLGAADESRLRKAGATDRVIEAMKGNRPKSGQQAEVTDIAIILDCSGSMMERQKEGLPKITSAKRVVSDLVQKIPDGLRLAFIVYGTETKPTPEESCSDIKILRPLSELDAAGKGELTRLIGKLTVHGNTPIADSLKIAARELAKNDAFCGIILISDGKETCNGDPAAEAAELSKNPKLSFGVNVIGLDVHDDEKRSLEQIAEKGKGKYYNADSAAKLEEAVAELKKEIESKAKGNPEQRGSRETTLSGKAVKPGAFLHDAGLISAGEYKGNLAMMQADYYKVAVHKGQEVRAIGQIQKAFYASHYGGQNNLTFSISVYGGDFTPLKRETLMIAEVPKTIQTLRATCNAPADGFVYIGIGAGDNTRDDGVMPGELWPIDFKPKPSTYALRIRLGEAAGESGAAPAEIPVAAVTAGNAFGQAGELTPPSIASTDIKIGEVVFYKAKVKKGEKFHVAIAVQKPWYMAEYNQVQTTYTLTAYDDDQVQIAQKKFDVKYQIPDAQVLTNDVAATLDGQMYFSISCENSGRPIEPHGFQPKPGFLAIQLAPAAEGAGEAK